MQIVKVPFILLGYCIVAVDVLNLVAANLQISVKPENEENIKNFSRAKMGITK